MLVVYLIPPVPFVLTESRQKAGAQSLSSKMKEPRFGVFVGWCILCPTHCVVREKKKKKKKKWHAVHVKMSTSLFM